jgi:hypothetical protein
LPPINFFGIVILFCASAQKRITIPKEYFEPNAFAKIVKEPLFLSVLAKGLTS